jgi:hypothetical protein
MGVRIKTGLTLGLLFSLIVGILLPSSIALADPTAPATITTSPVATSLNIQPGQSETTTLSVENNGTTPISVAVELRTFSASGDGGEAAISNGSDQSDPSLGYVHFSQTTITANPGVWTPIKMTISLPVNANLGYYYAVLFQPLLSIKSQKGASTYLSSNAILVLVDTGSTNEVRRLEVSSFTATKKLYEYLPATFNVKVHNSGNIFLPPVGSIYITRTETLSNVIATLGVNKVGGRVLPESSRVFSASWDQGFPSYVPATLDGQPVDKKNGQPVLHLQWNYADANNFRFGKYYAHLVLAYSNGQRDIPIVATVSFWVIPWKLILIALVLLLIPITMLIMALRYRHMYRKSRRSTKEK